LSVVDSARGQSHSSLGINDIKTLYSGWIGGLDQRVRLKLEPVPEVTVDVIKVPEGGPFSRELAAYLPGSNKISVSAAANLNAGALRSIVFHELGHAFVFNKVSPKALCNWAKVASPWRNQSLDCDSVLSHYAPALRAPHPLSAAPAAFLDSTAEIPSRYAMESIHEYFAESFKIWLKNGEAADRIAGLLSGSYESSPIAVAGSHEIP
jgi:hypothetical protein